MEMVIIGGSGSEKLAEELGGKLIKDSFGVDFYEIQIENDMVYFFLRHGQDHSISPAVLDSRKYVFKIEELDGKDSPIFITASSGSLDTKVKLIFDGGIVVADDLLRGFGFYGESFLDKGDMHPVMNPLFSEKARDVVLDSIAGIDGATSYDGGIYVHNRGNQFETKAEIADLFFRFEAATMYKEAVDAILKMIDFFGMKRSDVRKLKKSQRVFTDMGNNLRLEGAQVGMTAGYEIPLLKGLGYDEIALVNFPVNYGTGMVKSEKVSHDTTMASMKLAEGHYIVPFFKNLIENARVAYR